MNEWVQNKSVAIVGRAAYLADKQQGDLIDSHDVVIRTHCNLPHPCHVGNIKIEADADSFIPRKYQPSLGRKTSAFAPTNMAHYDVLYIDDLYKKLSDLGCQYAIQHKVYSATNTKSVVIIDYIAENYMPVHVARVENFLAVVRNMDYGFPLPGTLLIYEILSLNPSKLYLTGFTCFKDSTRLSPSAQAILVRDHKPILDLLFLRDIAARDERVEVDSEMNQCFEEATL